MSTDQNTPKKTTNPWAKKIGGAQSPGGGSFIDQHGRYLMAIKEVIDKREKLDADGNVIPGSKGHKGNSVIVRVQVVEAAKRMQSDGDPHEIGDVRTVVFNLDDPNNMGAGKLKDFLKALFDKTDHDMKAENYKFAGESTDLICDPSQPILGKLIRCETSTFTTKAKTQGIGTNWGYVPQSEEPAEGQKWPSIAEMRAKLLGG